MQTKLRCLSITPILIRGKLTMKSNNCMIICSSLPKILPAKLLPVLLFVFPIMLMLCSNMNVTMKALLHKCSIAYKSVFHCTVLIHTKARLTWMPGPKQTQGFSSTVKWSNICVECRKGLYKSQVRIHWTPRLLCR